MISPSFLSLQISLILAGPLSVAGRSSRLHFFQEVSQDPCHQQTPHILQWLLASVCFVEMNEVSSSVPPQACCSCCALLCPELSKGMSSQAALQSLSTLPPEPLCWRREGHQAMVYRGSQSRAPLPHPACPCHLHGQRNGFRHELSVPHSLWLHAPPRPAPSEALSGSSQSDKHMWLLGQSL